MADHNSFLADFGMTAMPPSEVEGTEDDEVLISLHELHNKMGFTETMLIEEIRSGRLLIFGPPVDLGALPKTKGFTLPVDCLFVSIESFEKWLANKNVPGWIKDTVVDRMK